MLSVVELLSEGWRLRLRRCPLRNGFRCVPADGVMVEDVLVATGEAVGHENISSASRMNKAVVVFLKSQHLVNQIIESGLIVNEDLVTYLTWGVEKV